MTEEERVRLAHFIAEAFTGIANSILNSEQPHATFSIVMDGIGQHSEHEAYCMACEFNHETADALGITPEQYRQAAADFNAKFCAMIGVNPNPDEPHGPVH